MSALPDAAPGETQLDASQVEMLRGLRNGALLPQLFRTWLALVPQQLRDLQTALNEQSCQNVCTIAHSMKSASYSIGAKFVGAACEELETAARKGDLCNGLQLFSVLQQRILNAQPEIERYLS
jgi:HPt (histidine-containing phosphotransfer) domain-containing protein